MKTCWLCQKTDPTVDTFRNGFDGDVEIDLCADCAGVEPDACDARRSLPEPDACPSHKAGCPVGAH